MRVIRNSLAGIFVAIFLIDVQGVSEFGVNPSIEGRTTFLVAFAANAQARELVSVEVNKKTETAYRVADRLAVVFEGDVANYISRIVVEDEMEPYKFSIDVDLRQRVEKAKIASISRIIRSVVPDVYQRVFVGMRVPGGAPEYWATAHHNPELEVRIVGMTAKEHADAKVSSFPAGPGEVIVAETQMTGLLAGRYQIIERPEKPNRQRFLVRIYYQGSDDPFEEALSFRDGAYWKKESAFGERYRITNGRFEIRDRDGLIQAAPLR